MSEWIKVSEMMPPNGEEVLIWDDEFLLAESTGSCNQYGWGIFWAYDQKEMCSVKCYVHYWQPLPLPPALEGS
jgi:hypothetical protein